MAKPRSAETELRRARDLLARAGHPNTPAEEARTCGVLAAQIAHRLGLVLAPSAPAARKATSAPQGRSPAPEDPREAGPSAVARYHVAKVGGMCRICKERYRAGERLVVEMIWASHVDCWEQWTKRGRTGT